jgi:hypothetical protein
LLNPFFSQVVQELIDARLKAMMFDPQEPEEDKDKDGDKEGNGK